MKKYLFITAIFALLILPLTLLSENPFADKDNVKRQKVLHLEYHGAIHGGTVEVIKEGLKKAQKENYQCFIYEMDTPGGTVSATREIVKLMLNSEVPMVVYVGPSGARAGSAGTFITMAGNIAAMAPGTNIGAAHPVMVTGKDVEKSGGKHMAKKVEEDTAAFIESIANQRGRNVEWARKAVLESSSITEVKALKKNVIDFIAKDIEELLVKMHGKEIKLKDSTVKFNTKGAAIVPFKLDIKLKVLNFFASPAVLMLLFLILVIGVYVEISHPGMILPAVAAGIALILLLFSTKVLPITMLGLLLIFLALSLFITEIFIASYGLLSVGGIAAFVFGALLLFDPKKTDIRIPVIDIIWTTILLTVSVFAVLFLVLKTMKKKQTTGWEGLIGKTAKVVEKIEAGKTGKVFLNGEYWNASSKETLERDEEVEVEKGEHLKVWVKKGD